MILRKFNYFEFFDKSNAWSLDGLILGNINLLVGKNATGKTNTYQYKLNLSLQKVQFEELSINGERKFKREANGIGKIFSAQFQTDMDFHLSPNQLVVTSKRDAIQHSLML